MAKFEDLEQFNSKEEAKKNEIKNKSENKQKKITPEDKRKLIAYAIIGIFSLGFVFFAVSDFNGDDNKAVQELETPESEADKYNTKLQAIEQGEKTTASTPNLEDAYTSSSADEEKAKNDESSKKLQEQLDNLENQQNQPKKQQIKQYNNQRNSNTVSQNTQTYEKREQLMTRAPKGEAEEDSNPDNSGFFRKRNSSSSVSNSSILLYASIHTDQIIKEGSRVKMRLTKTVNIEGNSYPVNTIIYGIAKIQPNRLKVEINKINQTDVKLEIFDAEDSNSGIYVETPKLNAMVRKEFKKDVLDEKDLQKIPFSKTLKSLFVKNAKEESIELLNNYKIIIKEKNEN